MKKVSALILALVMLFGMLPLNAFTAETTEGTEAGEEHTHEYTAEVTYPTGDSKGCTDHTCSVCGDSYRTPWLDEAAYEGKTIACIGDSITAAYGVTKDETDYVTLLAAQLGMEYIRLGASGTTLCAGGSRTCNIGKLTEANLNGADVVTIAMGINDFCAAAAGCYELGDIHSTDSSTIYGAARMWCERIAELRKTDSLRDTQFYFVTPVICSWNNSVTTQRDWDQSKVNIHGYTLRDLCNAIIEVAALYDVAVIDLNLLSGMYYVDAEDNNTADFGGDGVHPGERGHEMMARALANVLLQNDLRDDHAHTFGSWITTTWPSCLAGEQQRVCTVCSAVESRTADPNGNHRYCAVVTPPTDTQQGYTTYTCSICGDSYVGDYTNPTSLSSYRWEMQNNAMVSVTTGGNTANALTPDSGSITDGTFTSVRYTLQSGARLNHDAPWVIEWRSTGNWSGMLFGSTAQSPSSGLTYLFRDPGTKLFAFGEYNGSWNNYGMILDCDMTVPHVFRLENRIAADGSNAVYLLVDGQEIDAMHHYYISGKNQNKTVSWANGKDLVFANLGTTSHPVNGMKLEYLQIWENYHEHTYESVITEPTCTQQGYTTYSCACGDSYVDDYVNAVGHSYKNGVCSVCGSLASPYIQQLPEDIIGCSNLYDILAPTKGYYTATQYDTGNGAVLSVVIPVEPGDRIAASSFGPVSENMGSVNGIRVTYLLDGKIVKSLSAGSVYNAYTQNGYLTVPEGVNMVSVPWWAPSDSNWLTLAQISKNFAAHSPKAAPAQAPTCTEKGYTAGEICEVCNASLGTRVEIPATGHNYSGNTCTICGTVNALAFLDGKYVSVLGDSISTFNGYSNDATVNSTIGGNGHRYAAGTADTKPGSYCLLESVDDTWWMHFANRSGMKLLVNNSWAGSQVFGDQTSDGRQIPPAYLERCINLHDNTIDNNPGNAPINPDVIFVYLGINDYNFNRSNAGSGAVDYAKLVSSDGTYVTPTTFGEAYGILLHKMRGAYPDAQIFAMTLLPENLYSVDMTAWSQHNAYIRAAAEYYDVPLVDLAANCAITWENYSGYMIDKIHPTTAGMELISDCIEAELLAYYKENPPHVHTSVIDPAVDATCTETGLTEGSHCEACGEVLVAQEEVPALGHNYTNGICTLCGIRQTSTFQILDARCNQIETFTYEVGMTWREWLNSKYNTGMGSCIAIWVSAGPNILGSNPYMDIWVNGALADYDDVICEQDDLVLIKYH